jgi:hypothetical protein
MPYSIPPNAIAEITLVQRLYGQKIYMVRHYIRDPEETNPIGDGRDQLTKFTAQFSQQAARPCEELSSYQTTDITTDYIQGQWIYPTRWSYLRIQPTFPNGLLNPPTIPQNLAAVVTLQADEAGRTARGDVHIAGLDTEVTEAGELLPLGKQHVAIIGASLVAVLSGGDLGDTNMLPIIYHRTAPQLSKIARRFTVQETIRTMSRRTVGRGI